MDFLTFKSFISTEVLIAFYYMGALVLPIATWLFFAWLINRYELFNHAYESGKGIIWQLLGKKQQVIIAVFFLFSFLFMEIFWRMMFEFLIAYMQIRDALVSQTI